MVNLKTPAEMEIMRRGGRIAAQVRDEVLACARVGMTTLALDALAEQKILSFGAQPSFKGYRGYPFATCLNVNEGVVHGLPTAYRLKGGDLLSLDLGVYYQGFHSDTAATVVVGAEPLSPEAREKREAFLAAGRKALAVAVAQLKGGGRLGDVSAAMQETIEAAGLNVVRDLVGHGIGRQLHEDPVVPCVGRRGQGLRLEVGMVLALEVIYTQGRWAWRTAADGWTIVTADGRWGGLFEQTVALTASGPIVLTAPLSDC